MGSPSISCALPCCQTQEIETECSSSSRILAVGLGAIAVIVGTLALIGIPGLNTLGSTACIGLCSFGGLIVLMGTCLRCVRKEVSEHPTTPIPVVRQAPSQPVHPIPFEPDPQPVSRQTTDVPPPEFNAEKFGSDKNYRQECLLNHSWISGDPSSDRHLFSSVTEEQFYFIDLETLPEDVSVTFLKVDPRAKEFYSSILLDDIINELSQPEIAKLYGEKVMEYPPHLKSFSPESQMKILRSIFEYFTLTVRNLDKLCAFTCNLLSRVKDSAPEEQEAEFERVFELLNTVKIIDLKDFFKRYIPNVQYNDMFFMKTFPLFYVRKAFQTENLEALILALFAPDTTFNYLTIFPDISSELDEIQHNELKAIFERNNQDDLFAQQPVVSSRR